MKQFDYIPHTSRLIVTMTDRERVKHKTEPFEWQGKLWLVTSAVEIPGKKFRAVCKEASNAE